MNIQLQYYLLLLTLPSKALCQIHLKQQPRVVKHIDKKFSSSLKNEIEKGTKSIDKNNYHWTEICYTKISATLSKRRITCFNFQHSKFIDALKSFGDKYNS